MDDDHLIYEQLGLAARWYTGVEVGLRDILARLVGDSHTAHALADAIQPGQIMVLIRAVQVDAALSPAVTDLLKTALKAAERAGRERNAILHAAWGATTNDKGELSGHSFSAKRYSRKLTEPVPLSSLVATNGAILSAATVVGMANRWLPKPMPASVPQDLPSVRRALAAPDLETETGPRSIWAMSLQTMDEVWPGWRKMPPVKPERHRPEEARQADS